MATVKEQARALVEAKMHPMALSKKEAKTQSEPMVSPSKGPRYPWGLTLNLDHDTMKKLKIGELAAGQVVMLAGKAKVTRCEETEDESGERYSATIQITDLALTPARTAKVKHMKSDHDKD